VNPDDYDKISSDDIISFEPTDWLTKNVFNISVKNNIGETNIIPVCHTISENQKHWILAGSAINNMINGGK
jgi:hypothetical protein